MQEINVGGKVYIPKDDLKALIEAEKKEIREAAGLDSFREDEKRQGELIAVTRLEARMFPKENARRVFARLDAMDRVIVYDGEEELMYFEMWCGHIREGESTPVFSSDPQDALRFKDKGMARKTIEKIIKLYPDFEDRLHTRADGKTKDERLLAAIFEDDDEYGED